MKRGIFLLAAGLLIFAILPAFAQTDEEAAGAETPPEAPVFNFSAEANYTDEDIPESISNNRYFRESQRLTKLAEETYKYGDYDASAGFALDAIRYAKLSDDYVALQMKIKAANDAIAAAKTRIDWAVSSGASKQYPVEFNEADTWYKSSLTFRNSQEWDNAIDAASRVIELLAYIQAPASGGTTPLPATYTVRSWLTFKDCFWNIAARPWVYGDPFKWRLLYNANKSKLPDPDNPDLIEPGIVLDIPSIRGESRQGAWDSSKDYTPLE